jgi:hypothetical protein
LHQIHEKSLIYKETALKWKNFQMGGVHITRAGIESMGLQNGREGGCVVLIGSLAGESFATLARFDRKT